MQTAPFVAVAVALAACNALTGLSDDYHLAADGGGTTGNETGPGSEGGPETSVDDGGPDTALPEANVPDADAPICPMIMAEAGSDWVHCSDFEGVGADSGKFTSFSAAGVGTGTLEILSGQGYGDTGGLVAHLTRPPGGAGSQLWGEVDLPSIDDATSFSHYEVSFQLKVEDDPTGPDYVIFGLLTFNNDGAGAGDHGVALYAKNSVARTKVNNLAPTGGSVPLPHGWIDVRFAIDKTSGTTFKRTMTLDGTPSSPETTFEMAASFKPVVRLGAFYTSSTTGDVTVHFDRFVIRRRR